MVEINCHGQGGLVFAGASAGSALLGLAVDDASGNGVTLNAGSITLNCDYIGLDLTGAAFGNGGDGVYVSPTSSGNLIGLNRSGASGVVANVISGNGGQRHRAVRILAQHGRGQPDRHEPGRHARPSPTAATASGSPGGVGRNEIGGTAFVDPPRPGEQPDRQQGHGHRRSSWCRRWAT